jgi:poly-gamma-glutamate synthase PgsB/CapB
VSATLLVCLLVLLALGVFERVARNRALRQLPIRIHVNGTRAKSTVTRLIWSALLEAGIPAMAKTTGTAPRVLLPDRRDVPLQRRGPANVREQLAFLRQARRAGARAVVVECMAIDPDLQHVTERQMIRATIGVITNVRRDHTEVMGRDLASIADALANTIPAGGVLATSAFSFTPEFRSHATRLRTSLVVADALRDVPGGRGAGARWLTEDASVALAVTRQLGIDDDVARAGFSRAPQDPGAARQGSSPLPHGLLRWLDAAAANDPESLAILLEEFEPWHGGPPDQRGKHPRILVYHHRDDRGPRLECFARHCTAFASSDRLVISGARPPLTLWKTVTGGRAPGTTEFVGTRRLAAWLVAHASGAALVVCGNTRGLDVPRLLEEAACRD